MALSVLAYNLLHSLNLAGPSTLRAALG